VAAVVASVMDANLAPGLTCRAFFTDIGECTAGRQVLSRAL
jgi:hypothetical protein